MTDLAEVRDLRDELLVALFTAVSGHMAREKETVFACDETPEGR